MKHALIPLIVLAAAQASWAQGSEPLLQGVKADKENYPLEETVRFTFAVRNRGDTPLVYTFSSSKLFDIWVRRGASEVFRHSRGKMYTQAITHLTLQPGETKSFEVSWNQKDVAGKQVGPGGYTVYAQLTPMRNAPPSTSGKFEIGGAGAAMVPVTVKECIARSKELLNRRVVISGIYRAWQPDPSDPNCKDGPPVTRSDWVLGDASGCMYVTGTINLDPQRDVGTQLSVVGKVARTPKGQVYLVLESATINR